MRWLHDGGWYGRVPHQFSLPVSRPDQHRSSIVEHRQLYKEPRLSYIIGRPGNLSNNRLDDCVGCGTSGHTCPTSEGLAKIRPQCQNVVSAGVRSSSTFEKRFWGSRAQTTWATRALSLATFFPLSAPDMVPARMSSHLVAVRFADIFGFEWWRGPPALTSKMKRQIQPSESCRFGTLALGPDWRPRENHIGLETSWTLHHVSTSETKSRAVSCPPFDLRSLTSGHLL